MTEDKITLFPCAKINLGLNIVGKREDGYHNLETVFYPVPMTDILTIEKNGMPHGCRFKAEGIGIGGNPDDNIVVKAYDRISDIVPLPGVDITLTKNIPVQAGMGGGSSDCAFTITGLNSLFGLGLSDEQMRGMAAGLGADCAFFVSPSPAYATGIGEVLTPVPLNLGRYWILIVKTDVAISTKEAFSCITPAVPTRNCRDVTMSAPVEQWKELLTNDFEKSAFRIHPIIGRIKDALYAHGAAYAAMSGSGSAVFGLFAERPPYELTDWLHQRFGAFVSAFCLKPGRDNGNEILPLVDNDGRTTGRTTRAIAHGGSKPLHPVVHLHVLDSHGNIYLQKRPHWKDIQPDRWDTAVGGHIGYGEAEEDALAREAREELGLRGFTPEKIDAYVFESRYEREYVNVFRTVYDKRICPSNNELDGGRFWTRDEISDALGKGILTPNFENEFRKYFLAGQ